MKTRRCLYVGALVVALVVGLGLWKPSHVRANGDDPPPPFRVDASWPQELPAPVGYNYLTWPTPYSSGPYQTSANRWVQGEVACSAIDADDNVYTFNRGWEVGVTFNGTLQNSESGAINGNDATAAHAEPSPPVLAFDSDGKTITSRSFGNTTLWTTAPPLPSPYGNAGIGRSMYMPHGAHG